MTGQYFDEISPLFPRISKKRENLEKKNINKIMNPHPYLFSFFL